MRLVLVRHGEAEAYRGSASDAARQLTAQGVSDVQRLGSWLAGRELGVQRIIASPYARAQHTGVLLAENLCSGKPIGTASELQPDAAPGAVIQLLASFDTVETVLLASHQPLVGRLLNVLVGEADLPQFMPACCAIVEAEAVAAGCFELVDFVSPEDV